MKIDHDECPICLESLLNNIDTLPCKHVFHTKCMTEYIVSCKSIDVACPICRAQIPNVLDIITPIYTPCSDVRVTFTNINRQGTSEMQSLSSGDSSSDDDERAAEESSCCKIITTMFMHVVMPVSLFIIITHIIFPL